MRETTKACFNPALAFAALALCATFACNSNPTSPSADFAGPSSQGGASGATLNGTFQRSPSAFRASRTAGADDLTVVVYESRARRTEIASVDVVDDRFTLRGLPDSFLLAFMDGDTEVGNQYFEGIKVNQELDVLLSYDGTSVEVVEVKRTGIDHQPGDGIEIEGSAIRIDTDRTADWSGTLEVDKYLIGTRAAQTSIRKGNRSMTLDELNDGDQVHVRGVFEEVNGVLWVFAHEIKLQEEEDDTSSAKVTICHVPPGNPDNRKTKSVSADAVAAHLAHGDSLGPCP